MNMFRKLGDVLAYIKENSRSATRVSDDLCAGRCMAIRVSRHGAALSVQYQDGRRFERVDDRFYTPEAYVTLALLAYAMSSEE